MTTRRRQIDGRWWVVVAAAGLAGCQTPTGDLTGPFVSNTPTTVANSAKSSSNSGSGVNGTQAQVMDFADDFTLRLADMTDRIEARTPSMDARIAIHRLRYTMAHGLTVIAASANPKVSLVDAIVVMSIQRRLVEERLVPEYFKDMPWIASVFRNAEEQIKAVGYETFTFEQMEEIQALADRWVDANPYRYYGAYVRLADFAATRQDSAFVGPSRAPSLLGFLTLDPLAGLDPATKEIEQTRLFAERAMFYLQRMPQLISWQAELLYIDTASEPEVVQALLDVSALSASVERVTRDFSEMRDELPAIIADEREAAIQQASEEFFAGFAAERAAMLDDLQERSDELDATLAEVTRTFEAGDKLGQSWAGLITSVESLAHTVEGMRGPAGPPDEDPTTIEDYEAAIISATTLIEKLDELVEDVNTLANSDSWDERRKTIDNTMGDAQQRLETVLDRTYRRAFILIGVLLTGFLAIGLVLKLVPGRRRV
ncbi:MAG: hypothetical protein DHS20C14_11540 [Phycisphaeraceae bacterium]|nr:MAG: hypothetical protein DHS20C14_11540 [Phycisphaeraceae bacterium]